MSNDLNINIFGGRLTDDPREAGNGGCRFDVASNRSYKTDDGYKEETNYMPVYAWGVLAKTILNNCKKGSRVIVEGRTESRTYKDDEGNNRKFVSIRARDVRILDFPANASEEKKHKEKIQKMLDELPKGAREILLASIEDRRDD